MTSALVHSMRPTRSASAQAAACAPELRALDVDLEALEIGARDASDETQSYLDTASGEVVVIVKGEPDARLLRERVKKHRLRYAQVPPFGLQEERGLLRQFLAQTTKGSGRALLMRLVDEPGAFHACLAALRADPDLWNSWERFEGAGLRGSLVGWLASLGLRPAMILAAYDDE